MLLAKTGLFRVSYGARDKMLVKDAQRLEQTLPALGIPYDMKIYPQAGHGFMNQPANWFVRLLGGAAC
jgi:carboxymethylenebutenolidase